MERRPSEDDLFAALAFKIMADLHSASSPTSGSTSAASTPAPRSST